MDKHQDSQTNEDKTSPELKDGIIILIDLLT